MLERADNDLTTNLIAYIGPPALVRLLKRICPDEVSFERPSYGTYCEACDDLINIERNRTALYKYQGMLADHVLEARAREEEAARA